MHASCIRNRQHRLERRAPAAGYVPACGQVAFPDFPRATSQHAFLLASSSGASPTASGSFQVAATIDHVPAGPSRGPGWSRRGAATRADEPSPTAARARFRTGITTAASGPAATAPGSFSLVRSSPLAGGRLDVVSWREGRSLRIWTPPCFSLSDASREPYPVLYLNDGQNLFGDQPTLSGQAWNAAEAAAGLISSGVLPPFVVVGIDHSGAMRSYDYLPYKPGKANGYRLDAAQWPGGGVDAYLLAVLDEILPYMQRTYGVSSEPSLRCFGGSSFGGICALCAALRHPGVFGSVLVESPSLWFGEERLLRNDLPAFQGPWPARLFLAMGTKEYSAIRNNRESDFDAQLVAYTHELAGLLESKGLKRGERLQVVVEEGATHNEQAWAGRLPAALRFLGHEWRRPRPRADNSA